MARLLKNLPIDFINKYPSVPWSDIAGMRDKLIHHYFGIDLNLTFDVIRTNLPELKKKINDIIKEIDKESNKTGK